MATSTNEKPYNRNNLTGGIQRKTTKFAGAPNEVDLAINASFERIGGVEKAKGMTKLGNSITATTTSTSTSTSSSTSTSTSTSSTTTP